MRLSSGVGDKEKEEEEEEKEEEEESGSCGRSTTRFVVDSSVERRRRSVLGSSPARPVVTLPRHGLALRELARMEALCQLHQAEQEVREELEVERERERSSHRLLRPLPLPPEDGGGRLSLARSLARASLLSLLLLSLNPKTKTQNTQSHTAGFAVAATLGSIALGSLAMAASSRDQPGGELEASLRRRSLGSVDASVLAAANRSRLAVLLDEARRASEEKERSKSGGRTAKGGGSSSKADDGEDTSSLSSSEARYRAALRGESLGTHSGGTTTGATAISSSGAGRKETKKK